MEKAIQEGKALDMPNEIELEDEIVDELFEDEDEKRHEDWLTQNY